MAKKEYILQYVTIGVSFLAVIASIFAGWMSYRASTSAAEIGMKLNKINELETRNYENKTVLYNTLISLVNKIESGSGSYQDIQDKILENQMALEIYGSNTINQLLTCIDNGYKLLSKKSALIKNFNQEKDYQRRILLPTFFLKKEIRHELNNYDQDLYKFQDEFLMKKFNNSLENEADLEYLIQSCYSGGTSQIKQLILKNKSGSGSKILTIYPK